MSYAPSLSILCVRRTWRGNQLERIRRESIVTGEELLLPCVPTEAPRALFACGVCSRACKHIHNTPEAVRAGGQVFLGMCGHVHSTPPVLVA